jgi:hypothetical protein
LYRNPSTHRTRTKAGEEMKKVFEKHCYRVSQLTDWHKSKPEYKTLRKEYVFTRHNVQKWSGNNYNTYDKDFDVIFYKDKNKIALAFSSSDAEHFIYLYPKQAEQLLGLLSKELEKK